MGGPDPEFEAFLGMEEVRTWLGTIPREKTRHTYGRTLFQYWRDYLSKAHHTSRGWIDTVKHAQRSEENVVRKTWALEVQGYMNGYRSKITGDERKEWPGKIGSQLEGHRKTRCLPD